ncbi:MAG: replicative DNA helicase [Spirochaetales bacterium]|nr:replicative DNA helicase [Spirochaetales bacterium]
MGDASLKGKIPPNNTEAEQAALGAILLDNEAFSAAINFLRPDDFYKRSHATIFDAMISLFNRGEALDLITLTDELKSKNKINDAGGPAYISSLTSVVPSSANIEYYVRIIRDCAVRRVLLKTAAEISLEAHDDSKNSRTIVEEAERKIFEVTEKQQTGAYHSAGEIISRTIDAIEKLYHTKDDYTGVPSGFPDLDNLTSGFQNSEFIVIGARPSVGKTALALSMAANIAFKKKIPAGFLSLEMNEMAIMQRLISSDARINSEKLRTGMLRPSDFDSLTETAGKIYDSPLFICDTPSMRLLDLRAMARRMKMKQGIRILFVDYIGLIEPENRSNVPRHEQVAEISRSLKALARELEMPIVCLSQVGRQTEGKAPTLADLRESGSIEQDADMVIFLHRERGIERDARQDGHNNIETDLIVAKQRNGPVGTVKLAFIPQYTKFENFSTEYSS